MHPQPTAARGLRGTGTSRGRTQLGPALALIHGGRAPTRAALGASLGVTRATAGAVAAELQALGLIQVDTDPGTPGSGTLGRPSHRLTIDPDGPVAFAAQIHPDGFQVALRSEEHTSELQSRPHLVCRLLLEKKKKKKIKQKIINKKKKKKKNKNK